METRYEVFERDDEGFPLSEPLASCRRLADAEMFMECLERHSVNGSYVLEKVEYDDDGNAECVDVIKEI